MCPVGWTSWTPVEKTAKNILCLNWRNWKQEIVSLSCLLVNLFPKAFFSVQLFLQFWTFWLVYITFWEEITWKFVFISSLHTWKNIILCSKRFCDLCTIPYYLQKIASVEKIWTLVNYISWCLTDHMAIWTRFVNGSGGFSEYLLSAMWSFGHLFGYKNVRRWCFLGF